MDGRADTTYIDRYIDYIYIYIYINNRERDKGGKEGWNKANVVNVK